MIACTYTDQARTDIGITREVGKGIGCRIVGVSPYDSCDHLLGLLTGGRASTEVLPYDINIKGGTNIKVTSRQDTEGKFQLLLIRVGLIERAWELAPWEDVL